MLTRLVDPQRYVGPYGPNVRRALTAIKDRPRLRTPHPKAGRHLMHESRRRNAVAEGRKGLTTREREGCGAATRFDCARVVTRS
jgi:hypothetical protein